MAGTVRIAILANAAKARSELASVADESEKLGSRLKTGIAAGAAAAGAGLLALGAGLGKSFVDGVKNAESYERMLAKTAAVIKSTGNASKISVKGVKRLAGQLETLSGVDEELIVNSQNVLATFTKVRNETGKGNKVFDRATKAAVDMSAALGSDLQGATLQLGKALNDPLKGLSALTRSGVSFTQQQKENIKALVESGETFEAQKVILAEVERQFGGAAKAAGGEGLTGAINRMKDAWGDMWRDVAGNALPVLEKVTDWVTTKAIPKFGEWVTYVQTEFLPKVSGLLAKIDLPAFDFNFDLGKLRAQAEKIVKPFVDGIKTGIEKNDWGPLGTTIGTALNSALTGAGKITLDIASALKDWASGVNWLQTGKDIGKQAVPFIIGFLSGFLDLGVIFDSIKTNPMDWVFGILAATGIGKVAGLLGKAVAKIPFLRALEPLLTNISKILSPLTKAFDGVFGFLKTRFLEGFRRFIPASILAGPLKSMAETAYLRLLQLGDVLKAGFERVFGLPVTLIGGLVGRIVLAIGRFFVTVGTKLFTLGATVFGKLVSGLRSVVGTVARPVRDAGGRILGALRDLPGKLAARGREAVGRLRDGLKGAASNAKDWLIGAGLATIDGFWQGLQDKWEDVKAWFGRITSQIPDLKGPAARDRKLLFRNGTLVLGGFEAGLRSKYGSVKKSLRDFTRGLADKKDVRIISDAFTKAFASIQRQVAKQRQVVADLVKARKDYASTLARSLTGGGLQAVQIDPEDLNPRLTLVNGLKARLAAIKDFQRQLKTLSRKGLSADLVRQIADAGLEGGAQYLTALAGATPDVIRQFNSLNRAIKAAAGATGGQVAGDLFNDRIRDARAELPAQKVTLKLDAPDSRMGKLLIEMLRDAIRKQGKGGKDSVQLVLG